VADSVRLNIVGQDKVLKALDPQAAKSRIKDAMNVVVNDAASAFSEASPVGVYGNMQGAWLQTKGVEITSSGIVGYSDPTPTAPYAWFVIFGRGPGKMPPISAILPWVAKKLGETGEALRAVAFLIARSIGRKGTKSNDFITPIVTKRTPLWKRILEKALAGPEATDG
jgi:hypothetical protein